jgi:uncharacterized membrane protein
MSGPFGATRTTARLEKLSHFLIGIPLIMKGIDKAEHFDSHPFTVLFLFAAGAFILLGAAFHHRLEKKIPNFIALFHVAEGLALIVSGIALLEKSSRLPYFLFFLGFVYLGLGAFNFFTDASEKKRLLPLFMTALGLVFLVAAAVFLVFNHLNSRDPWAYFSAVVIALVGIFILLVIRKKAVSGKL